MNPSTQEYRSEVVEFIAQGRELKMHVRVPAPLQVTFTAGEEYELILTRQRPLTVLQQEPILLERYNDWVQARAVWNTWHTPRIREEDLRSSYASACERVESAQKARGSARRKRKASDTKEKRERAGAAASLRERTLKEELRNFDECRAALRLAEENPTYDAVVQDVNEKQLQLQHAAAVYESLVKQWLELRFHVCSNLRTIRRTVETEWSALERDGARKREVEYMYEAIQIMKKAMEPQFSPIKGLNVRADLLQEIIEQIEVVQPLSIFEAEVRRAYRNKRIDAFDVLDCLKEETSSSETLNSSEEEYVPSEEEYVPSEEEYVPPRRGKRKRTSGSAPSSSRRRKRTDAAASTSRATGRGRRVQEEEEVATPVEATPKPSTQRYSLRKTAARNRRYLAPSEEEYVPSEEDEYVTSEEEEEYVPPRRGKRKRTSGSAPSSSRRRKRTEAAASTLRATGRLRAQEEEVATPAEATPKTSQLKDTNN